MALSHIPRRGEMVPLSTKQGVVDIKPLIMQLLDLDEVIEKIEPYKLNGSQVSPTGSNRIDDVRTMDIVLAADDKRGGSIRKSGLLEVVILQQINVCLRRRYIMDKKHKIIGINGKNFGLLGHDKGE